jgi:hypothetical protein
MISAKNMDRVSLVCHATVANMFAMFCNEKYRGENFTWDKFPKMMAGQCRSQVFMADIRGKNQNEVFEHAEKTGFDIAKHMVETAGFKNE